MRHCHDRGGTTGNSNHGPRQVNIGIQRNSEVSNAGVHAGFLRRPKSNRNSGSGGLRP